MKFRIAITAALMVFWVNRGVSQCPVSITPSPASVCAGSSVALTANATGTAPFTYSWSSGGSGSSISVSPASTTTYSVTITDGTNCTATASVTVTVNPKPNPGFTFTGNNACAGTANSFTSTVTGGQTPYTYSWNFGGQGTSSQANPSYTFNPVGTGTQTYSVTLTVTGANGCTATTSQNVTIRRKPDASIEDQDIFEPWTFCDAGGGAILTVNNSSTTQADNTNYVINWGDGSSNYSGSTLPNGTSHTYTGQGYFNVALTVTGSNGCTATSTYPVFSGGNPQIGLANPGGTTGICTDKQITFPITNFANNPPGTTYTITVNDGSAPVVYQHPPPSSYTHNFTSSSCNSTSLGGFTNAFHVRIVAENPCGTTAALVEPIRIGGGPVADFTFTPPPDICVGNTVAFASTAEGTFITGAGACITALQGSWTLTPATGWTLVSGSMSTPDPISVNFTQAGQYNMRLIVSNPCGSDTTVRPVCVAQLPDANYTSSTVSGCAPLTIPFTNTSNTVGSCANTTYLWTVTHNGSLCSSGGSWSFQSGNANAQSPAITFTGSGTYTVSLAVTNNCGTNVETKTITVDKIPELTIAPLPNICAGNTINPGAVINPCYSSITSVNWSFPGGSPSSSTSQNPGAITYGNSGTFTVTLSATNACGTGTDNETFTIAPPPPVPVLSSNSPVCAGQTITINTNTINGVTYTWTGPGLFSSGNQNITIPSATVLNSGTYTLVVTDGLGCANTASINVVVNPLPLVTVNSPQPLCTGGSVQLTASGANTYTWTPASGLSGTTGASVTANPTATTTYTVTGTNANGCSNSATALVTINPLPNISVTQPPAICAGQSTALTASGGTSYSWSPSTGLSGTSGATVTANPNSTTSYTVTGTNAQGCSNTATTTVTVNPLPNVTVNNPPAICAGQSATLNATGATSYIWSPAAGLSATTGSSVIANPNVTTTYTVTGTTGGCSNSAQVAVTVNPRPVVSVNSGTICVGNSITLNAGGANTYAWSPAAGLSATTGASVTANPTSTTTYTVTGTDGNSCTNTAAATVTVQTNPTVDAGSDQTFCNQNIPVQLTGIPNGGAWSGTGVTPGGSFNPQTAGLGAHTLTYSFTNAGGCSGNDNVTITVISPTIPNAGNDFSVCRNAGAINLSLQLNPNPPGGTWSGLGVLLGTFTPSLALNGSNTITYTTGTGTCQASDVVAITVNPQPTITVNSPSVCAGNSVTLAATGGNTYSWSPATSLSATSGASVTANPSGSISYTVTGTDANGCTNTATSVVTVNPLPTVNAGPDQTFCEQNIAIQLTGTPNGGTWSGTGTTTGGSFNPANAGVGAHTITYSFTNANGCSNTDVTVITVTTLTVPVAGNDFAVCRDAAVVDLNLQNNPTPAGGTWSGTGVSGNSFNPANGTIGQNTITYSFGAGTCLATDAIIITVNALPVVTVNSPAICFGNSTTLNAGGADTYNWSPSTGLSGTTGASVTANPASTTTYSVTGTDGNNCVNTATSTVTIYPLPIVDAGPAQTFCDQNIPVQLNGTPANGNWTGNGVTPSGSFNPSSAGVGSHQLTYTFTDANICTNSDSVVMTVIVPTIANAGNDFPLCVDASPVDLNLQNNPTPAGGTWSGNGVANNFFTAANAATGQNQIVYSIGTGTCLSMDTIAITVNPLPTITVNSPTICERDSVVLTASGANNYSWNPISTLSDSVGASVTASPITTTTYTVRGVDGNSCVNTRTTTVTVNPLPIVDAGPAQTFCNQNIPVQLNGTPANGNWTGNGVTPAGSFNPSSAGVGSHPLTYTFTDANVCTNSDSVVMTVIVPTIANAGNDFPLCVDASPVDLNAQNNPTPAGGTWSGNGVANNFFTAANAATGQNPIVYSIGTGTCLSMDTIAITVNPLPTITVNSPTICERDSVVLTASGANNYSWNPTTTLSDSIGASVTANPVSTTTYTVRGVDGNSCVNTNTAIVTVNPLPVVDAGPVQTFCDQNIPVQLNGIPSNGNWAGSGVTPSGSFNPSSAGVGSHPLTYTFTDANICTNSDSVVMTVIVPTLANAGNDFPLCVDASPVDLNAQNNPTPAGGTWSGNGVANNFFTAANAATGQNQIVYSIGIGTCLSMDTAVVIVNPLPVITVNSPTICERDSVVLTASGANNYSWNPTTTLSDSIGASVTANPVSTTIYTVRGVDGNSCVNTKTTTVTVNPLPVVDAGPAQTFCNQNIPVQLNGTPANGNWTGSGVTPAGSFNPSSAGVGSHQLTYTFTDANVCTNRDSVVMTVIVPTIANAGNDFPLCVDASPVDLNAQNNPTPAGGTWSGNGVANNFFTAANAAVGQNEIVYSIGTGTCLSMDTVVVTVNPLPIITVNSPTICERDSVVLTASGANNYSWNPISTLSDSVGASVTANPVSTTTYSVSGVDGNSCVNTNTATVTVNPLPVVDAGPDQSFCNTNTTVNFTGNPANGIWNGTGITSAGIFNPAQAGVGVWALTYSLTDGNSCTNRDTTHATVVDPQFADAGPNVAICVTGIAVDLTTVGATPAGGTWSGTGVTANLFYPFAAGVGLHTLTYSFGTGTCQTSDNTSATVNPQPALSVNSPEICFRDTALLTVFGADNYQWSPLNELSVIGGSVAEAYPTVTTQYLIVGTIAATGCSDTIISTVTVHPLPVVDAGGDTSTCNQPQYPTQLQATPAGGIWSGNFISQNGLFTPSGNAADTGSYSVSYVFTDGNSCTNSDNAIVNVIAPVLAVAGPDKSFCVDDAPATLTGFTPASGGTWSGNGIENQTTGLFNPSLAGVGSSRLYYDYGTGTCATRDSVVITINPLPTPAATFNTTCIGDTTFFTDASVANAGSLTSWSWDFGDGATSTQQNPSHIYASGNFNVTFSVMNSFGCDDQANLSVVIHPLPTVAFTHDSMVCPDSALQIYLTTVDALNYTWDFGDGTTGTGINPAHSYTDEGTYQIKLVAETQFGCLDSSTSSVLVPYPPNAFFTFNPKEGCAPLDVSFYPILPPDWTGLRYMWIFGNGDTTFSPIPPDFVRYNAASDGSDTSYVVEFYVYSHTCQNFGKFVDTVKVLNTPPAVISADFTIGCGQTSVLFTNTGNTVFDSLFIDYGDGTGEVIPTADLTFEHSFISTSNSNVTYTVTYYATGATCNSIPGTIPITVYPNTVKAGVSATPQDVCKGEEIVLTNSATGGSYFYYDFGTGIVSPVSNASQSITLQLDTGSYTIYQHVYSADSCSFAKDSLTVRVHPAPVSDFEFSQPSSGCDGSEVTFTNISTGSGSSVWDFGDNTTVVGGSPIHIFETQGSYTVTLITESAAGCKDTLTKPVTIDFLEKGLYVPNAFSPEFGDPKVREFKPAGQCMEYYHLHIYNTWGELLWETYELTPEGEPAVGWNGRHMKTGLLLPQDVYVWKIEATFINESVWAGKNYDDGRTKKIGSVTLLR